MSGMWVGECRGREEDQIGSGSVTGKEREGRGSGRMVQRDLGKFQVVCRV